MKKVMIIMLAIMFLGGCATMKGTSETIHVGSNESGVKFFLDTGSSTRQIGSGQVAVTQINKRDLSNSVLRAEKEGCEPKTEAIKSGSDATTLMNILIPYGGIGLLIDAISGAYTHATQTDYILDPKCK